MLVEHVWSISRPSATGSIERCRAVPAAGIRCQPRTEHFSSGCDVGLKVMIAFARAGVLDDGAGVGETDIADGMVTDVGPAAGAARCGLALEHPAAASTVVAATTA